MLQFHLDRNNITRIVELIGQAATVMAFLWRVFKKGLELLKIELNEIITENVNRGTSESVAQMKAYTDLKFTEHESAAFGRIEGLERALGVENGHSN